MPEIERCGHNQAAVLSVIIRELCAQVHGTMSTQGTEA
jgi:hypothetical protein